MIQKAYAKINLVLDVVDKRTDGYHDIKTIMFPLELHDSVVIDTIDNKNGDDFIVCDNFKVGIAKYNLCHKAIQIARETWGFKERFDVSIHKNIFLQSGLGGGSADAAAVIKAIVKILKLKVSKEELIEVATKIGADVPFMLFNKPSLVLGIGNKISFLNEIDESIYDYYVLLCKPLEGISTTRIYSEFDQLKNPQHFDVDKVVESLKNKDENWYKYIGNSLEEPGRYIVPEIEDIKQDLISRGFDTVFMTGGGSCLVALTKKKSLAKKTFKEFYMKPNKYEAELTRFHQQKK